MLNAIFFYRIARWFYLHRIPFIPKLITLFVFILYNSKIPYQAEIGRETIFAYGAIGVVIHSSSKIGEKCLIGAQVTIGGGNNKYPGVPKIGNNVYISKGAIVFGGITIGNNVIIGANAVVNKSVPNNVVVAGVPAVILRKKA